MKVPTASEYIPTIGLEIHAELKTATKMFCSSRNDADEARANVNVCPVCLAHPGTLPVINREAVRKVLLVGHALGSRLADYTEFDRKNYFYPDLPKGYQLSQYEYPLVSGGVLNDIAITRVHLEEDTASSIHDESGTTTIDYNRAGVPLMELVTEPVIHSSADAGAFARELQLLLRYLKVSEANMEKGQMRVEANVSVCKAQSIGTGTQTLGTKVEIKNLNSFRIMERAVEYEIRRQSALLDEGKTVTQETRGWDEARQATFSQRVKEGSADYRYFPDPDLPSLRLSELPEYAPETLHKSLPELPWERRARYRALGVRTEDADSFVRDIQLGSFFEEVIAKLEKGTIGLASNYIANDLVSLLRAGIRSEDSRDSEIRDTEMSHEIPISAAQFRKIVQMAAAKKISSRTAKDLILRSAGTDEDPQDIAKRENLLQDKDPSLIKNAVEEVLGANKSVVKDYKSGKAAALEYLVGQCMKALRGGADPALLREELKKHIGV